MFVISQNRARVFLRAYREVRASLRFICAKTQMGRGLPNLVPVRWLRELHSSRRILPGSHRTKGSIPILKVVLRFSDQFP
jgi:hypothetical protein